MDHPDPEALASYARGELGRDASRALELHLASCMACQGTVDGMPPRPGSLRRVVRWGGHRFQRKDAKAGAESAAAPDAPLRRARVRGVLRALGGVLTATSETGAARLLGQPEHRRRVLIRSEEKLQTLGLCELLLAKCRAAWTDDPDESVELAKLAALVAQRLNRELYGGRHADDARVMAWVHLGISFRLAGSLSGNVSGLAEPQAPTEPGAYPAYPAGAEGERDLRDHRGTVDTALRETREAFLERGMPLDAALVTLDLVSAALRSGRPGEIAALARESVLLFEAQGVDDYPLDAMRFLQESAEAGEGINSDLVARMAALLHRKRNGMDDRFEG